VEELLARFPAEAAQLGPELRIAARLMTRGDETQYATPSASGQARATFLAQAASMAPVTQPLPHLPGFLRSRLVISLIALVAVLVSIGGGVFGASAASLPGDPFYGVKRSFENIQLSLVRDPVQRANLEETFLNRRVEEVKALQASKGVTNVEFVGNIEAMEQDEWIVDGFTIQVTSTTLIEGSPQVGSTVQVTGQTWRAGRLSQIGLRSNSTLATRRRRLHDSNAQAASASTLRPVAAAANPGLRKGRANSSQRRLRARSGRNTGANARCRPSRTLEPPRATEPDHTGTDS
jgi:hypothetical protein